MNKNEFVKEIKKLDKSCFYLVSVDDNTDFETMANIADILDKQGIKSVVMPKNINFKLKTASMLRLLQSKSVVETVCIGAAGSVHQK